MMPKKSKSSSKSYKVGYRRPPNKFQFKKGRSGNPTGKRNRSSKTPDLKAQLESELNKAVTIRSGKQAKTLTKAAAGIKQLVDQFAKGDRNARRDLFLLSEKLGVALTNRVGLEGALQDALSPEDEALLADFVKRHGGQYPVRADMTPSSANQGANLLSPPEQAARLLTAPPGNSIDQLRRSPHE
jgi:Family of unknown function (DUF5681)